MFPPADCWVTAVSTPQDAPLHPVPDSDHAKAWVGLEPGTGLNVAAIVAEPAIGTLAGAEICSVKLLVIVSVAEARLEGSATLCAVSARVAGFGKICGAVKLPFVSTVPHARGHAAPDSVQRTALSGWPLLVMFAWKVRVAPSSTETTLVPSAIWMSLVMVTLALADFFASAWLVAVTCTTGEEGRSAGAVYTPAAVIVPVAAFPPGTPLTLQVTLVLLVFATVAVKVCEFPKITGALDGDSITLMEDGVDGGGGGATGPTPTPAQPRVHAPAVRRARNRSACGRAGSRIRVLEIVRPTCGKGCMPVCVQANNQRKP